MSSAATAIPFADRRRSSEWIESPGFDLFFFTLAPLVTLSIVIGAMYHIPYVFGLGVLLAYPHYFSTGAFLMWDENRAYQRARWIAFVAGPIVIALLFAAVVALRIPVAIQFALFFWTVFHVSRQSCGIASIYRNRAGVRDPAQKHATNAAIILTNLWFALWNINSHPEIFPFFQRIHPRFTQMVWMAAGVGSLLSLIHFAGAMRRRTREGAPARLAEWLFLAGSVALFHPYLWLRDSSFATYAMLLPHYVQYLGLVWLLHRRKFRNADGSAAQHVLHKLSTSIPLLLAVLVGIGLVFWSTLRWSTWYGQVSVFTYASILLAFEHYYFDGLVWAFKQPHVRRTIGPFLLAAPRDAGLAEVR